MSQRCDGVQVCVFASKLNLTEIKLDKGTFLKSALPESEFSKTKNKAHFQRIFCFSLPTNQCSEQILTPFSDDGSRNKIKTQLLSIFFFHFIVCSIFIIIFCITISPKISIFICFFPLRTASTNQTRWTVQTVTLSCRCTRSGRQSARAMR